jgi:hypothetical protein
MNIVKVNYLPWNSHFGKVFRYYSIYSTCGDSFEALANSNTVMENVGDEIMRLNDDVGRIFENMIN